MIERFYAAQIEFTRGCNYKCDFCGNHSLPKQKKFMRINTLTAILSELRTITDKVRIDIAMRGEPTLNENWLAMVSLTRTILPRSRIAVYTNGSKLTVENIQQFYGLGGNLLMVDCYGNTYEKYRRMCIDAKSAHVYVFGSTKFNVWGYHPPTVKYIILMPDIRVDKSITRTFTNQCGAVNEDVYKKYNIKKITEPLKKVCTIPFREITFHYNGDVPICCKDWVGNRIMYNIHTSEMSLYDYWFKSKELMTIRRLLKSKCREFVPCNKCDWFGGFYHGFLPKIEKVASEKEKASLIKSLDRR